MERNAKKMAHEQALSKNKGKTNMSSNEINKGKGKKQKSVERVEIPKFTLEELGL